MPGVQPVAPAANRGSGLGRASARCSCWERWQTDGHDAADRRRQPRPMSGRPGDAPPRRVVTPRRRRPRQPGAGGRAAGRGGGRGHVRGLAAGVGRRPSPPYAVAARPLRPGDPLTADDVRFVPHRPARRRGAGRRSPTPAELEGGCRRARRRGRAGPGRLAQRPGRSADPAAEVSFALARDRARRRAAAPRRPGRRVTPPTTMAPLGRRRGRPGRRGDRRRRLVRRRRRADGDAGADRRPSSGCRSSTPSAGEVTLVRTTHVAAAPRRRAAARRPTARRRCHGDRPTPLPPGGGG